MSRATIAACALLAACAGRGVRHDLDRLVGGIPRAVLDVQVVPVFTESTQGTAITIGPNAYLTCSHVIPKDASHVHILGAWRPIEVVRRGTGSAWSEDWVWFSSRDGTPLLERPAAVHDFDRALEPGTEVFLVGHRGESVELTTVLAGEIVAPPTTWNMPTGVAYAAVDLFPERTDEGMSGAAAVVLDPNSKTPLVVGILIGRATVTVNDATAGYLRVIARPPVRAPAPLFDD